MFGFCDNVCNQICDNVCNHQKHLIIAFVAIWHLLELLASIVLMQWDSFPHWQIPMYCSYFNINP